MVLATGMPPSGMAPTRPVDPGRAILAVSAATILLAWLAPGAGGVLAAEAIASTDGEQPGARLEVTELKRASGGTVMLKFTMVNEGDAKIGFGSNVFGDADVPSDYRSVGGVHLIDAANKKKYLVIRDSERTCLCSRDVQDVAPGARAPLWARFPAPPEDVGTVSIVVPHFLPLDDVPIGR